MHDDANMQTYARENNFDGERARTKLFYPARSSFYHRGRREFMCRVTSMVGNAKGDALDSTADLALAFFFSWEW